MKCYQFNEQGHLMSTVKRDECPDDATTIKPDCNYPKWTGTEWIEAPELVVVAQKQQIEIKIQNKTRDMAIKDLIKDGELPPDYEDIKEK